MYFRRFFEPTLAQTSYLIACEEEREAIVIDPSRDIAPYLEAIAAEGFRLTWVTETHIHADFVSGTRELAARTGARIAVSAEGGPDWLYAFAHEPGVAPIRDGDRLTIGTVHVEVLHTPGHTPEHLTFLVSDRGADPHRPPIGAVTGDFLFAGDVGRPDLLERAAGVAGTMDASARTLYRSLQTFLTREDWLQIWPGHGAGSACGKAISALPQSTLGYERRFNWACQPQTEDEFVRRVLAGQVEPPAYFAVMKRINREGPRVLADLPRPDRLEPAALFGLLDRGTQLVDTRGGSAYAVGAIPGSLNLPRIGSFTTWAGSFLRYDADVVLLVDGAAGDAAREAEVIARDLALIGLDRVTGFVDVSVLDAWADEGRPWQTIAQIGVTDVAEALRHGAITLVDVRNGAEFEGGHIPGARHIALGELPAHVDELRTGRPVVVHCQTGGRSAIAASLLRTRGLDRTIAFPGGMAAWAADGRTIDIGVGVA